MARVEGERLGRCIITKLKPGAVIDPHVDSGDHAAYFERYHIVLQSLPGSVFHAGGETVQMRVGEVWWFDNSSMHSVINNSADDRIHLIVDIKACK
jgi:quercetin dioxygenase-like cupin family protein